MKRFMYGIQFLLVFAPCYATVSGLSFRKTDWASYHGPPLY